MCYKLQHLFVLCPHTLWTVGASDSSNVVSSHTLYYAAVCMCCIDFHWNCECGYVGHLRENGVLQSENVVKCEMPICLCRSINSRHMPDLPMAVHFDFCHITQYLLVMCWDIVTSDLKHANVCHSCCKTTRWKAALGGRKHIHVGPPRSCFALEHGYAHKIGWSTDGGGSGLKFFKIILF